MSGLDNRRPQDKLRRSEMWRGNLRPTDLWVCGVIMSKSSFSIAILLPLGDWLIWMSISFYPYGWCILEPAKPSTLQHLSVNEYQLRLGVPCSLCNRARATGELYWWAAQMVWNTTLFYVLPGNHVLIVLSFNIFSVILLFNELDGSRFLFFDSVLAIKVLYPSLS